VSVAVHYGIHAPDSRPAIRVHQQVVEASWTEPATTIPFTLWTPYVSYRAMLDGGTWEQWGVHEDPDDSINRGLAPSLHVVVITPVIPNPRRAGIINQALRRIIVRGQLCGTHISDAETWSEPPTSQNTKDAKESWKQ
jgi:hypothetical protein